MNCTACGNTGLVPVEKGPAGATYTVLARCKCQTDTVIIPRAKYEALMGAAEALHHLVNDDGKQRYTKGSKALAALRAAGITEELPAPPKEDE